VGFCLFYCHTVILKMSSSVSTPVSFCFSLTVIHLSYICFLFSLSFLGFLGSAVCLLSAFPLRVLQFGLETWQLRYDTAGTLSTYIWIAFRAAICPC
jgi:hypothetical protein